MKTTKIAAALLALGLVALPVASADAASRHYTRPAPQQQQAPVYEGRNATLNYDRGAADNSSAAIRLQEQGNARSTH